MSAVMKTREQEWPEPGLPDYEQYIVNAAANDLADYWSKRGFDRDAIQKLCLNPPETCRGRLENAA